jgi:hypothetical protein
MTQKQQASPSPIKTVVKPDLNMELDDELSQVVGSVAQPQQIPQIMPVKEINSVEKMLAEESSLHFSKPFQHSEEKVVPSNVEVVDVRPLTPFESPQ